MPLYNPPTSFTFPVDTASTANEITNSLSSTAAEIIPANTNRKGLTIFNTLNQTLYLDAVPGVTNTNYMVAIPAGGFYELPTNKIYTGHFYGILSSGTGSVEIREFT